MRLSSSTNSQDTCSTELPYWILFDVVHGLVRMCIFGCVKIFGGDVSTLKAWEYAMVERLTLLKALTDKYKCVFKGNIRDETYTSADK